MNAVSLILLGGVAWLSSVSAWSQDIPNACKMTLPVKNAGFTYNSATLSCRLVETKRGEITAAVLGAKDTGEIDGEALAKALAALSVEISKQEKDKNWTAVGLAVTGNAMATYGLSICTPTAGAGCFGAAVAKIMALYGTYDAAKSEADKSKNAKALNALVAAAQAQVAGKKSDAKRVRDQMIKDSVDMCTQVQKHCL